MKTFPPMPTMFMNPEYPEFLPTEPTDFVGGARKLAFDLVNIVERSRPYGLPIKIIIPGPPGFGKSSLALFVLKLLNCTKWGVGGYSGADVSVDVVRDLAVSLRLSQEDLFGDYRVIVVQEADEIPRVAQTRFLDVMDNFPKKTAVICTCNSNIKEMEPRFQTRFKAMSPERATDDEVVELIRRWPVPEGIARKIAQGAKGNVRVALLEAEEFLQTVELIAA